MLILPRKDVCVAKFLELQTGKTQYYDETYINQNASYGVGGEGVPPGCVIGPWEPRRLSVAVSRVHIGTYGQQTRLPSSFQEKEAPL